MINFLKKFCSFGFSKDGSSHWIWQRISALLLIFLFSWLIFSFQKLLLDFTTNFYDWIKVPINLILFITLFIIVMHHSTLGILNIFEDYIQSKKKKEIFFHFIKNNKFSYNFFIDFFRMAYL